MTKWSQDYTVKSNARRAARADGVDPSKVTTVVKANRKLFRYPLPDAVATETKGERQVRRTTSATKQLVKKAMAERKAAKKAPAKPRTSPRSGWAKKSARRVTEAAYVAAGLSLPDAEPGYSTPARATAAKAVLDNHTVRHVKGGDKFTTVAALLRRPGGASITEVTDATGWKPHSARARISVDVSKLLAKGETIERRREAGVSHYAIVPDKQMDLPIPDAA
jgi:hypothetical protein